MRNGHGEEKFRSPVELSRSLEEIQFQLGRSRALEAWWPEAFSCGSCSVRVERGEVASYHVVAERPDGVTKREPLRWVPKAVWREAAETIIVREKSASAGGSALEKVLRTIEEQG
jgi:hypothetical protein